MTRPARILIVTASAVLLGLCVIMLARVGTSAAVFHAGICTVFACFNWWEARRLAGRGQHEGADSLLGAVLLALIVLASEISYTLDLAGL